MRVLIYKKSLNPTQLKQVLSQGNVVENTTAHLIVNVTEEQADVLQEKYGALIEMNER